MSNRKLGILAGVAAVMVLWAAVQSRMAGRQRPDASKPTYLVQGLDETQIASIVVGHGDDAVTIGRQGGQFVVVNEVNYPADTKQINDLITKTLDIKTSGTYTSDAKNHEALEVTEEKAKHVVKFLKEDGSLLTGIVVGKSLESGQDTFVRLASNDTVYLAKEAPWFRSRALDFVNQEIVAAKREDVNSVTVTTPEGAYTLRAKGSDDVVLANLPADKTLKESDAKSVFTALTSLRFDDVNTPDVIEGLTFDHTYVCRLDDSTEYRLQLAKKGEKTYLKCEAQYTDPAKVLIDPKQQDSEEELKKKEAKLLAQEHAQKFTIGHKNWLYEIPDWKAKYLMMSRSALLEDVKKEAEEEPAEPNQPAATEPAQAAPPQPAQPPVPAQPQEKVADPASQQPQTVAQPPAAGNSEGSPPRAGAPQAEPSPAPEPNQPR